MAYGASIDREEFIRWLGGFAQPAVRKVTATTFAAIRDDSLILLWADRPESTGLNHRRPIIVIPGDVREFFAFVTTYVSTFQPFSAFFRVVSGPIAASLLRLEERASYAPGLPLEFAVGPMLMEARSQLGRRSAELDDLTIQACLATASRPLAEAILSGLDREGLEKIFMNWSRARAILSDDQLRLPSQNIHEFWLLVSAALNPSDDLWTGSSQARLAIQFLREAASLPYGMVPEMWGYVTEGLPRSREALQRMDGSREDRVRALDSSLVELAKGGESNFTREIVAGFLSSRVSGGSLRYAQLLDGHSESLPAAILWFAFFSAFHPDTDILTIGENLGRRVARRLTSKLGIFQEPTVDISVDELELFMMNSRADQRFRTEHANVLTVEVFPGIGAAFRTPREWRRSEQEAPAVSDNSVLELRYLIERMEVAVESILPKRQRDLFGGSPTYKRPKR